MKTYQISIRKWNFNSHYLDAIHDVFEKEIVKTVVCKPRTESETHVLTIECEDDTAFAYRCFVAGQEVGKHFRNF